MFGGEAEPMEADSTMTDGWGFPPLTFAGTYGRNIELMLGARGDSQFRWLCPASRVGRHLKFVQDSSTLSALPQRTRLNWFCQLPPAVGPVFSMTKTCTPQPLPYFRYSFALRPKLASTLYRAAIFCHQPLKVER